MEITLDKWDTAIDSQARAFLLGAREASRLMGDGGRIIAITYAPGGRTGSWQPWVAMGAAKSAMDHCAAILPWRRPNAESQLMPSVQGGSRTVNSLPMEAQITIRAWHREWTPMGRLGTPADIGNAVTLLCSDEASWITGQVIAVDGGSSLMDSGLPLELQQA